MGLGAGNAAIKKSDNNPPFGSCTLVQKMNFEQNGTGGLHRAPSVVEWRMVTQEKMGRKFKWSYQE